MKRQPQRQSSLMPGQTRSRTLELLRVAGTHREVGEQVGAACSGSIRRRCDAIDDAAGDAAQPYLDVTRRELPWLVEELDGVADAAGVDRGRLFAAGIEELDDVTVPEPARGCTDLVACAPASADSGVWVAHTNDLSASEEEDLIAIEWRVPGDPVVLTVGVGPWISVGFNSAGLSLTGNEVAPNDNRTGIPRLLHVRDIVRRRTLEDAVAAALHPARASSYNTVLAHAGGGVISVEGSATDAELIRPDERGTLAHTNHYVSERMLPYEADVDHAARSDVRYRRALSWLAEGTITAATLRAAISDHRDAPDSICRHPGPGSQTKTVFWCIADVTRREITFGRGNPCDSDPQHYVFD
ncbi:MAG TPA: C45 family peptidase [Gaiellales bacterium]|nr:C45 family peptidase [Gaiellales bacterium]